MAKNEGRALRCEEDILALAEELAARFPPAATENRKRRLPTWAGYGLSALGGAGFTGLCWWASMMG